MPGFVKCCNSSSNNGGITPVDQGDLDSFITTPIIISSTNITTNNFLENQEISIDTINLNTYYCCVVDENFSGSQTMLEYGGNPKNDGPAKKFYLKKNNGLKMLNPSQITYNNCIFKIESIDYNRKEARLKKINDSGASVSKTFRMEDNNLLIEIKAYEFKGKN